MSLRRTPPRPRASPSMSPLVHCKSDSNINESPLPSPAVPFISSEYTTSEPCIGRKRKHSGDLNRDEVIDMFSALCKRQDDKFAALMTKVQAGIDAHTEQNKNISTSIDFLAQKYDEMVQRINLLEQERFSANKYIQALENRLEAMDRYQRSTYLEVRNVPKKSGESKEDLINIMSNISNALNISLQPTQVRDAYRINNDKEMQPILVDLCTVGIRDKIISAMKTYNRKYPTAKLSTTNLKLEGPNKPIYISEGLTMKTKKLFYLAREFAKSNDFKYCWTTRGKIYLRRRDGAPLIKTTCKEDLDKLIGE